MDKSRYETIGAKIIDAAYAVHSELGPGLLESVYEYCMLEELKARNLTVYSQVKLPLVYKGRKLAKEFIIDILVENEVVVELKAVEILQPIHEVQMITYMKLAEKKLGYLINFNVPLIKNGIKRKVNNYFFVP